jgi:NADPH:quinone reductase-like Zn-dependent oxidoreductase
MRRRGNGPEVIQYGETARPSPGPGEILLEVAGASFNPADIGDRSGEFRSVPLPFVLGFDVAGTVGELTRTGFVSHITGIRRVSQLSR